MPFEVIGYRNRVADYSGTVLDQNGLAVNWAASDKCRVKIGRDGAASTPVLDLVSGTPTANGSLAYVTLASNAYSFRIEAADMTLLTPGLFTVEVIFVDNSDGDRMKVIDVGTLHVLETMVGATG